MEVTKESTGLYLLDEVSLLKNLILSLGFREEWVTYDLFQDVPRAKDKNQESEPAWNVGLDYLFDKKSSVFLSAKRSFRFPVTDELIQFFPIFQVNPNMKPQTGYHYEAGVRHAFTDQIEANLTLFWIDTQDEIFFNPVTFTNENFPKTRRQGIEVGGKGEAFPVALPLGQTTATSSLPFDRNPIREMTSPESQGTKAPSERISRSGMVSPSMPGPLLSDPDTSSAIGPTGWKNSMDITPSMQSFPIPGRD